MEEATSKCGFAVVWLPVYVADVVTFQTVINGAHAVN